MIRSDCIIMYRTNVVMQHESIQKKSQFDFISSSRVIVAMSCDPTLICSSNKCFRSANNVTSHSSVDLSYLELISLLNMHEAREIDGWNECRISFSERACGRSLLARRKINVVRSNLVGKVKAARDLCQRPRGA